MKGFDLSSYQAGMRVADLGADFLILKIGEGRTLVDNCFDVFYRDATAAGIPVGAYFYSYATTPDRAAEDAQRALTLAAGLPLPLGIYMDVEEAEQMKLRDSELTAVVKSFCDTIRAGGYRPGAYGSLGNLWAKVGPSYLGDDVLVWVAAWCNSPPKMGDLWQYTDRAQAQGKNIDGDQALSDRFKALVQNKPEEEPEPAPAPTPDPDPEPQTDTFTISGIPALKKGDTGAAVIALQGELIACGYSCGGKRKWNGAEEPDGIFGNITEESVRSFQRAHNIPDTGIADNKTRTALIGV